MENTSNKTSNNSGTAEIYPFYAANRFYLFYKQTYLDVRLVATPPNNVGQFAGKQRTKKDGKF